MDFCRHRMKLSSLQTCTYSDDNICVLLIFKIIFFIYLNNTYILLTIYIYIKKQVILCH